VYPDKEEVFTAGVFYKHIQRPIEDILSGNNVNKPVNGPDCANYGFELVAVKYFAILVSTSIILIPNQL